MTIWKAIAILSRKLGNALKPCSHEWIDQHKLNIVVYHAGANQVVARKMVQRCSNCRKYRRLKIF